METEVPCALSPCPQKAVVTLRLLVDGLESTLPTCRRHADWFRGYVEEDACVQLLAQLPETPQSPTPADAAGSD
jgi:hypothetical protein